MLAQRIESQRTENALRDPRFEIIPLRAAISEALALQSGTTITVTSSPRHGVNATLDLAETLAQYGYRTVPHLAARLIVDHAHLHEIVQRLDHAGIHRVFIIAGDAPQPAGAFASAGSLLSALADAGHPFREIGIAGYPEGHPLIDDLQLWEALAYKQQFADYIVTQMCFDSNAILSWMAESRRRGISLPFVVGIPGAVSRRHLIRIAGKIGVGESRRFLTKQHGLATQLMLPGQYGSDELVDALGPYLPDPAYGISGFHIYTFNEVGRTHAWWVNRLASTV